MSEMIIKPEPDDASSLSLTLRPTSPGSQSSKQENDPETLSDDVSEVEKILDTSVDVELRELNCIITCPLCAGYVITATRIIDCFHVFCKSCIVQYLQHKLECPECGTRVCETAPWQSLRTDKTFQKVVFKLVPGLEEDEKVRRKEYESNRELRMKKEHDLRSNNVESENVGNSALCSAADDDLTMLDVDIVPETKVVVCLEPLYTFNEELKSRLIEVPLCPIALKYIRCSETVSIRHLIALIKRVLNIPDDIYIYVRYERYELSYGTRMYEINNHRPSSMQHIPILLKYRGFRNPFLKYSKECENSGADV